ncbi:hypothetical protein [Chitinophaga sp. HK235]|uniref:hypothetical protein n=1 Tax=Chitinophaga sp. HK235 TaxID=2952571 RepID=UPI001BA6C5C7|nr:hypothetical protein [Chitinophaga sp. HK235]
MYSTLIFLHSAARWLVVGSLFYAIYRAYTGYRSGRPFTETDNAIRHWTATIAHIQLVIGMILYTQSPIIQFFWKSPVTEPHLFEHLFFALIHLILMLTAIVLLIAGSAITKRKKTDQEKFRSMLLWFTIAFFILFVAIPWPFSPLSHRPYFR